MSVGSKVAEAIEKMAVSDYEEALFQICSAIDATATAEAGKRGRGSYKDFIHDNLTLITKIGFDRRIQNMNFNSVTQISSRTLMDAVRSKTFFTTRCDAACIMRPSYRHI
jgi:hypothetical protein